VAIKASAAKQIDVLVEDLASDSAVRRETAIARLTVLGARAVDRLIAIAESPSPSAARVAAFVTLEALGDPRALDPALGATEDADPRVAIAAIAAARVFLRSARGASAVDRLTTIVLDLRRPDAVRLAALHALLDLERSTVAPLLTALARDASDALRTAARESAAGKDAVADPSDVLANAAEHALPDDPNTLRLALVEGGSAAPLPQLLRILERVREREGGVPAAHRAAWINVRAAAHAAVADRGSRIALYDLRESLETAKTPLPVEFLKALALVGDVSCLEAIATAHAATGDAWWRGHLANAFQEIVTRERLTRGHAALRRVKKRWPGAVEELWAAGAGGAGRTGKAGRAGKAGGAGGGRKTGQ